MNTAHLQVVSLHPAGWSHISKLIKDQITTSKNYRVPFLWKVRRYKLDWKTEEEGTRLPKKPSRKNKRPMGPLSVFLWTHQVLITSKVLEKNLVWRIPRPRAGRALSWTRKPTIPEAAKDSVRGCAVLPGRTGKGVYGTGRGEAQLQMSAGALKHPGLYWEGNWNTGGQCNSINHSNYSYQKEAVQERVCSLQISKALIKA